MGSSRHGFVPPQFALKHKEFAHLREVKMFPNALNPHKEEARALVRAMIDRVMELHRDLRWFHIGCDEVYYLGEGEESKQWLQQQGNTPEKLCLFHIKAVASYVASSYPTVTPIMWDDMLRGISEETLAGVSPVMGIWGPPAGAAYDMGLCSRPGCGEQSASYREVP